tara:strand:+ start:1295 stop:1651 length:357 start_codon:yes stop_codon:yes gene_type:complete
MLNKTQQKTLEAKVGPLELLPANFKQELILAFLRALAKEKKQKELEQKYSTYAGTPDTPDRKMERYRRDKAAHYGLLPGIVCSCFREDTAATPCSYVPDEVVGWKRDYYAEHGIWWKI